MHYSETMRDAELMLHAEIVKRARYPKKLVLSSVLMNARAGI